MKKLPPVEKIYEAYTAVTDNRVIMPTLEEGLLLGESGEATVESSDGSRSYLVTWQGDTYTSSDNATYWQGYPGYPVIAVLMTQGRLPLDTDVARMFSGVNWRKLNKEHGNDYAAAVKEVMVDRGHDVATVDADVQQVYSSLASLPIKIRRGTVKPPQGK
ncbi:MAG: hypothetical protein NC117_00500 [Pseudoflavonifractor sp.]|nr:hypothetical protein [Pseudoflavonifractor sp.]